MKTYSFKVVVEPDDDRWHAHCPALERYGASTWGNTEEEAFKHIQEVVQIIIAELTEDGIPFRKARAKTLRCCRTRGLR
jgi:predicted RNase H-like HicB family nuclease